MSLSLEIKSLFLETYATVSFKSFTRGLFSPRFACCFPDILGSLRCVGWFWVRLSVKPITNFTNLQRCYGCRLLFFLKYEQRHGRILQEMVFLGTIISECPNSIFHRETHGGLGHKVTNLTWGVFVVYYY